MSSTEERQDALAKINPTQIKKGTDSAYFRLVGGPWHDLKLRLYAPFDTVCFGVGDSRECYELHAPIGKSMDWVYVYTPKEEE